MKTAENIVFTKTFWTPWSDSTQHVGKTFEVLRPLTQEELDIDTGFMWKIRLEDGTEFDAYPEEIVDDAVVELKKRCKEHCGEELPNGTLMIPTWTHVGCWAVKDDKV